jgi:hypothetical protein
VKDILEGTSYDLANFMNVPEIKALLKSYNRLALIEEEVKKKEKETLEIKKEKPNQISKHYIKLNVELDLKENFEEEKKSEKKKYDEEKTKMKKKYDEKVKILQEEYLNEKKKIKENYEINISKIEIKRTEEERKKIKEFTQNILKESESKMNSDYYLKLKIYMKNNKRLLNILMDLYNSNVKYFSDDQFIPKLNKLNDENIPLFNIENQIQIHNSLPIFYQHRNWKLLYDTSQHGISFDTFFQCSKNVTPTLLIIKTMYNDIFGAFCSGDYWKIHNEYYGDGQSYLFSFQPEFIKYSWSKKNNFFMFSNGFFFIFF